MEHKLLQVIFTLMMVSCAAFDAGAQRAETNVRLIEVEIFLQRTLIDPSGSTSDELSAVKRRVAAASPLRSTLAMLFAPQLTPVEEKQNFYTSTFGMKFQGLTLKNGTAIVRFSQHPSETNYGSAGAGIFADAIEQTAKQFPAVKRVKLCAVGGTMIDSESMRPFPRCRRTN